MSPAFRDTLRLYLTDEKNIMGINGARVIDLGRRMKNTGATGPLDKLDVASSSTSAFHWMIDV